MTEQLSSSAKVFREQIRPYAEGKGEIAPCFFGIEVLIEKEDVHKGSFLAKYLKNLGQYPDIQRLTSYEIDRRIRNLEKLHTTTDTTQQAVALATLERGIGIADVLGLNRFPEYQKDLAKARTTLDQYLPPSAENHSDQSNLVVNTPQAATTPTINPPSSIAQEEIDITPEDLKREVITDQELAKTEEWVSKYTIGRVALHNQTEENKRAILEHIARRVREQERLLDKFYGQVLPPLSPTGQEGINWEKQTNAGMLTCQLAASINALRGIGAYDPTRHTQENFINTLGGEEYRKTHSQGVPASDLYEVLLTLAPETITYQSNSVEQILEAVQQGAAAIIELGPAHMGTILPGDQIFNSDTYQRMVRVIDPPYGPRYIPVDALIRSDITLANTPDMSPALIFQPLALTQPTTEHPAVSRSDGTAQTPDETEEAKIRRKVDLAERIDVLRFELQQATQSPNRNKVKYVKKTLRELEQVGLTDEERQQYQNIIDEALSLKDPLEVFVEKDRQAAQAADPEAFHKMDAIIPQVTLGQEFKLGEKSYVIQKSLGGGAYGIAYLAITASGENIVLKVAKKDIDEYKQLEFIHEAYNLILLNDYQQKQGLLINGEPLTPKFVCSGRTEEGNQFIAMTEAKGTELKGRYTTPVTEQEITTIGIQVAQVLEAVHNLGKGLHDFQIRDIFLDRDKKKITMVDWNLVAPTTTGYGEIITPNPQEDLHRVSNILLIYLTGLQFDHLEEATISKTLKSVFRKALDPDPVQRYQTAKELKEAFEKVASDQEAIKPTPEFLQETGLTAEQFQQMANAAREEARKLDQEGSKTE